MTKQQILAWIAEHRLCYLATAEGDQPRVRTFGSILVSDGSVHFVTQKGKDVCHQLIANPKVEMCFYDAEERMQVRVSGSAAPVTDETVKRGLLDQLPFIKSLSERRGMANMALFRVEQGRAVVWSRETRSAPKQYVDL